MNVVAVKKESVLIEVTKDEFANLLGKYSKFDIDFKEIEGLDFTISDIYTQHYQLTRLLNMPEYNKAQSALKYMLEALEPIDNLIEQAKEKYEIKTP